MHKEKLRYRSSLSDQARHRVLASSTDFEVDAERRLRSVTATEAVSVSSTLPVPEMSSSLGLTLKLLSVQRGGVDPS